MLLSFLIPYFYRFHRYHISDVTIDNTQKGKVKKWKIGRKLGNALKLRCALSQNCMFLFAMGVDAPDDKNPRKYIDEFLNQFLTEM